MSDIKTLAQSVAVLGDNAQHVEGQLAVLTCAVSALVHAHPDPEAFAAAMRRQWQLAGSQHSNGELGSQTQAGIDAVLGCLEEACSIPLNIRPPRNP